MPGRAAPWTLPPVPSPNEIVAEGNQGGELVRVTLQTVDENVPVTIVHATHGKRTRAEPVAALYEQGRVHHVGTFPTLEDQLCLWDATSGDFSPDRLDALVWAVTQLGVDSAPLRLITTGASDGPGGRDRISARRSSRSPSRTLRQQRRLTTIPPTRNRERNSLLSRRSLTRIADDRLITGAGIQRSRERTNMLLDGWL